MHTRDPYQELNRVLEIVDACFHCYASSYRNDAKKYAMELMNSKPNSAMRINKAGEAGKEAAKE